MSEKIQKILAGAGFGSRREIEQWLRDGKISVNGKVAILGERITYDAHVRIDGREVRLNAKKPGRARILMYHKPEGEICSRNDPEERPSVFDHLPLLRSSRWVSVGRLDFNTSGVLLFTNDGELAHQLMHPSTHIEREYAVRVTGQVSKDMLTALKKGVELEDGFAQFSSLSDQGGEGSNHWYHVTVEQGRNRIVRRLFESQGIFVSRLIRIRFGSLTLPRLLRRGKWAELTLDQVTPLLNSQDSAPLTPHDTPKKSPKRGFAKPAPKPVRSNNNGKRPFAGKRDHARPERDGKPSFNKPFRPKRDDAGPARRDSRPSSARPFAGKRDSARPEREGKPSFNKPFRPKRDDAGPARRDSRPSSARPFAGKRDSARPEREGKPSFNKPFRPKRDDAGPARRDSRPSSARPFAGKRDSARPEREGKPPFNKPFRPKRDDAGPARRDSRPGARPPFAGKRDGARADRGRPSATPERSSGKRFSNDVSPKNKITRWEKYPSTAPARSSAPRKPSSRPSANNTPRQTATRSGPQRRTVAKPSSQPVLKLRNKDKSK